MDVLVHLSLREGLARALPQALAASKPVIAYDADGAREICLNGRTGFLVQPGDLVTLSKRILELSSSPALRTDLGREGQAMVRDCFPVERMVTDIYRLYQQLLAKPGVASGS